MLQVVMVLMYCYIRAVAVFKDCDGPTFDFLLARHINQILTGFYALVSSINFVFGPRSSSWIGLSNISPENPAYVDS